MTTPGSTTASRLSIDSQDAVQSRQDQQHRSFVRERAARESGARAAGHQGDAEGGEKTDDGDQLFASSGKHDEIGNATVSGETIHRVGHAFGTSGSNVTIAHNGCEVAGQDRGHAYIVDA